MTVEELDTGTLETWTPDEVQAAFDANEIALIDVRTPQEYMFEHVPGALLLPLSFFDPAKLPSQKGKRLVFHCGSGVRSDRVARAALDAGLGTVAHMGGGFAAWKAAGKTYLGTDMATGAPRRVDPAD
jgi:rhodanese-related sulfurtransferase